MKARLSSSVYTVAMVFASAGCTPASHSNLESNLDTVMSRYSQLTTPTDATSTTIPNPSNIPWMAAKFCVERAKRNALGSSVSNGFDVALIVLASLHAGLGTASYAASTSLEGDARRKTWSQVGSINIAAAAAVLGLRTALDLGRVAREQRTASADQIDAALKLLELLALEPDESKTSPFTTCTDGEKKIADTLARDNAVASIKASIEQAQKTAEEAEAKKKDAAAKKKAAESKLDKLGPADKDNSGEKAALEQQKAEAIKALAKAELEIKEGELADARAQVLQAGTDLRRAVLYFTKVEVEYALEALKKAHESVTAAKAAATTAEEELKQP